MKYIGPHCKSTSGKEPAVSIVMPAFNVSEFIGEAVGSVLNQTYSNYEIIVVDDGSDDKDLLDQALGPFKDRIIFLRQNNQGVSAARNAGVRMAQGEYIAFLDADDVWLPNKLSEQVPFLKSASCDMVYADGLLIGDSPSLPGTTFMQAFPSEGEVNLEGLLSLRCNVLLSTVLVRKDILLAVDSFDEEREVTEDYDLWLRLALNGARINYQRTTLAKYRYRPASRSSDRAIQHEQSLRALDKLHDDERLTAKELGALARTESKLRCTLCLERSKMMILDGDFESATALLWQSWKISKRWKVFVALFGLYTQPQLLQRFYSGLSHKRSAPEPSA